MHQPAPSSSELSLLPAMFSFSGPASLTQFDFGPPSSSEHQLKATNSSNPALSSRTYLCLSPLPYPDLPGRPLAWRITLEDDDEDLDEEPVQRRPVLVISDSLKEGLERGISDILPHTVTQSLAHSGMELVLWRPPQDPFCQKLKDSLQKQRKQQAACRQLPTPCPSPTPHSPPSSPTETHFPLSAFPEPQTSEEDMEM
ncbi:Coiled-coil domain-containing protein 117 [Oryzias melastigma]|uniref:Coiled-coil domain-containing protein 117 n=1 Tax=Oryzias melastigma TaxID=30732 RepID=A0A834CIC0_ORYME|nr:Coiled-coil domain-containing protein 117 [Oryzias melastigma]